MIYLALSVIAPFGQLIRSKQKTIEVRRWMPDIKLPIIDLLIVENNRRLSGDAITEDPNGVITAIVDISTIIKWTKLDLAASCSKTFEEGWLAWELNNVRRVEYPFNVPAKLRIYEININPELLRE
jgi:hypothetical protein